MTRHRDVNTTYFYVTVSKTVSFMRVFLLSLFSTCVVFGQQANPAIDWLTELQSLEARLKASNQQELPGVLVSLQSLEKEIQLGNPIDLPALPKSSGKQELLTYVGQVRKTLEERERTRPGSAFYLGRVEVNVAADATQVPTATTIDESEYRQRDLRVVTDALNLVPGVSVQRIGPRNERGVFVRGFDVRQVPLYIDGIPVYVPYDGYVDLDRFLTYDVGEMQVSKGFTSPLYGPNAIGGAVNLISKAPTKPLNLDLGTGYGSGDEVNGFANAGARWKSFWAQGAFAWLSSRTFPLSGDFQPVPLQPAGNRLNADQTDYKGRVRLGWTPNQTDQYTFTYSNQRGEKGNPTYAGSDPAVRPRYWQWPYWDKESFYFIGNKSLGETTYVRARLYYDKFDNLIRAYDNACYCRQTLPSSFTSPYDDDTYGTSVELGTRALARQTVKTSFYFKDDTHREGNLGEPTRSFRDQSFSFGFEDTVRLGKRTSAILGFSADRIQVMNAENFVSGAVQPFPKNEIWAYNPQAGIFHALTDSAKLHFTFARKTRLPTIKDRYSYRMGQAIPNPDLREERSDNWEIGYSQILGRRTLMEFNLFRSNVSNSTQRFFVQPNVFQLRNLGEARYQGGEFGVRSNLTSALQLNANYTYLSRKNESNPGLLMVDTPKHKVYSSATYTPFSRITLLADLRYEAGRFYQNDAGTFGRASQFATVGLGGTARMYRQIDLQAGINNLLDRNYFLVDGYPESGRTFYVNLRYRF